MQRSDAKGPSGQTGVSWGESYVRGLLRHLAEPSEEALAVAYELGREGIREGLGHLSVVSTHNEALRELVGAQQKHLIAGEFLAEALAPYEMLQRGFRETIRQQGELNRELELRALELARANETIGRLHRERSVFISEASRELASSLELGLIARAVVRLAVPRLAAWAQLELGEREDRLCVAAGDAPMGASRRKLELRVGAREVAVLELALGPEQADPEHQALISEFADRAALGLENARLFEETSRAVEVRNQFLSIASHELKTPLTPLLLGLGALRASMQRRTDAGSEVKVLDRSIRQVHRLRLLVQDMLDEARIQAGRLELNRATFDLRTVVHEAITAYSADPRGSQVRCELPPGPVWVNADAFRIEQVLMNLLDNALKYGGREGEVRVRLRDEGGQAVASVQDRGIGIPEDQRARVFEPFFRARNAPTRHYGGLGLGLHICAELVERHRGRIWVEEAPGGGTVFSFSLPQVAAPAKEG